MISFSARCELAAATCAMRQVRERRPDIYRRSRSVFLSVGLRLAGSKEARCRMLKDFWERELVYLVARLKSEEETLHQMYSVDFSFQMSFQPGISIRYHDVAIRSAVL